jgi:hypothetical protein
MLELAPISERHSVVGLLSVRCLVLQQELSVAQVTARKRVNPAVTADTA